MSVRSQFGNKFGRFWFISFGRANSSEKDVRRRLTRGRQCLGFFFQGRDCNISDVRLCAMETQDTSLDGVLLWRIV